MTNNKPSNSLDAFYNHLFDCIKTNGLFTLKDADGRHPWPGQGVYFFFDPSEPTPMPGLPGRIVRIGTHGVSKGANTTLWGRLKQHRGSLKSGGGNYRSSIFRWHIGYALKGEPESWLDKKASTREVGHLEHDHECLVSDYIRQLSFTVIGIPGTPSKDCQRAVFESECIAFLSWACQCGLIKIGDRWLGHQAANDRIKQSGLWNVNDVWVKGQPEPRVPTWPPFDGKDADIEPRQRPNASIIKGAGNVYEELESGDAYEMMVKAKLAATIKNIIESKSMTHIQAAETIGLPLPKLSCLLSGQFRGVSVTKMMEAISRLGRDVQIVIGPERLITGQEVSERVEVIQS